MSFTLPAVNPCYWSEPLLLLVWAIACWPFLLTRPPSSTVSEWTNWYLLLKWASPLEVDSSPVPLLHSDRPRKLFFYFWDFLFYVHIRICSGNDRGTDMWPLPTLCIPCCHFCKLCSLVCFCVQSHVCKSSQLFCLEQSTLAPVCGLSEKRFEYNTQWTQTCWLPLKGHILGDYLTNWVFWESPMTQRHIWPKSATCGQKTNISMWDWTQSFMKELHIYVGGLPSKYWKFIIWRQKAK